MSIFAIGDLHLCSTGEKPMDVFGSQWDDHWRSIRRHWRAAVGPDDTVLIPGDISWAMQLSGALEDLRGVAELPGRKVLLRGNHDYWWSSVTRLRSALPDDMRAIQNDSLIVGDWVVCGTRGWEFPTEQRPLEPSDQKIYLRELMRLEMALEHAARTGGGRPILAMTHYPPLLKDCPRTAFTDMMERYDVRTAVYGHLHGAGIRNGLNGECGGVRYQLVSCDAIGFAPLRIE